MISSVVPSSEKIISSFLKDNLINSYSLKDLLKKKEISEDEEKQSSDYIQKITDKHIQSAENILKEKESDLMQV